MSQSAPDWRLFCLPRSSLRWRTGARGIWTPASCETGVPATSPALSRTTGRATPPRQRNDRDFRTVPDLRGTVCVSQPIWPCHRAASCQHVAPHRWRGDRLVLRPGWGRRQHSRQYLHEPFRNADEQEYWSPRSGRINARISGPIKNLIPRIPVAPRRVILHAEPK